MNTNYKELEAKIQKTNTIYINGVEATPNLESILMAIKEKSSCVLRVPRVIEGGSTFIHLMRKINDVEIPWKLGGNLSDQNEVTINLLHTLLVQE